LMLLLTSRGPLSTTTGDTFCSSCCWCMLAASKPFSHS
jgi:hypothetical protein